MPTQFAGGKFVSQAAVAAGERFFKRVTAGDLTLETLTNKYDKFHGELEARDLTSFDSFVVSPTGTLLMAVVEARNAQGRE